MTRKRSLPKKVGPYEIERRLASGGMGEVVLATNVLLERRAALKRVLPVATDDDDEESEAGQEEAVQRFLREGKLLARLHHQGVCQVYDIVQHRGAYWMALEYVDGFDLKTLAKKALPVDVALIVASQVADALDHAHRSGVVHRDLKPANVMVSRKGEVKLLDFGIARADDAEGLTATGMVVGTPSFLAPEVLRGAAADARSDVYGLGATLYRVLAGRPLFPDATPELVAQHILAGRIAPLRSVNPNVPRRVAKLVHRCLALQPAKRFPSAGALREALEAARESREPAAERLVAFLHREGHLSQEEALTVVDSGLLEPTRTAPSIRGWLAAGALVVVLAVVLAATVDRWLPLLAPP